ncbi:PREDICTED: centromere protein C isoform X2 [Galeopterus variegatus]|uniref:Centromere protein C isoform X2 n=1 Tax=Galeopterus variegatus TaxID=482537 RepID=A0ABM0RY57_GALVR|nr:PREDICTED: centromere protein C isoform X2 [Galeopterus variegatus]
MATSGLDHLKNDYRRRFCRPSRAPDINTEQGQNILEILQDCFEEKSFGNDFSTNPTKSVLSLTPKIKDICIKSPNNECQKSHPKSVTVSSRKEETSLQFIVEPSETASRSVQAPEVHQKILATDVGSENVPDSKNSRKRNDDHSEVDEEFYLSVGSPSVLLDAKTSVLQNAVPSVSQKRETYTLENSVNVLSSSTEISLKTKKRLNFEDKDILKKVEIESKVSQAEDKISERQQERKSSGTFQKRIQDPEYEVQPQAKKSFSTLFLETVKRKSESSSIVRHVATVPPHSSPPNDTKLTEDEFIIDESDRSFASQSWIMIPRKSGPLQQHPIYPAESTVLLQGSKKNNTKKDKEDSKRKSFSHGSKKNKLIPEEVTSTVLRSRRISRRPSDWWVVKSEQSPVYSNSSIRNELSVHHNSTQKPSKKTNRSSKNTGKKTIPIKRQKTAPQGSPRVQKVLNAKCSEGIIRHGQISSCSQNEPLESDEADQAKKKNLDCSGSTGSSKDHDGIISAQSLHLKSQTSGYMCKTPTKSNLDYREPETSVLEGSGPSILKNYLISGKKNFNVDDEEVQESSDDSRVKRYKVAPENKVHHKLVLPSNTPNVRRTKRIRLKPLEYWRGERIDYQGTPSGGLEIGGILSPDTVSSKRKAKGNKGKINKIVNKKKICLDNDERKNRLMVNLGIPVGDPLQPTRVKDPETREIVLMDLIRPRDTYQLFVDHGVLKVYKTLDTPFFSTGKLILGPHEEKGKQHVGPDILVFNVNFGDLLCTLHETPYIITTGDSFYVPSGNHYSIKNLLNEESVLLFTQIKR